MTIPTTLTIYVPDDSTQTANALRASLRAALVASCVGTRADFPPGDDGRAFSDAARKFYHQHPGLLDVVTFGGTVVFRSFTGRGEHPFRRVIPEGIDYVQHNDPSGEIDAEIEARRGAEVSSWASNTEGAVLVAAVEVLRALAACNGGEEERLRGLLRKLSEIPPPSYSVGERRYEEDWE